MNHRTRVDWNYIWIALYHASQQTHDISKNSSNEGNSSTEGKNKETIQGVERNSDKGWLHIVTGGKAKTKFVLKDELKVVPGLGELTSS